MTKLGTGVQLQQKLSSQLVMAPQMAQSLKILAMDSLELEQYIDQCLESNPLLERESDVTSQEQEAVVHAEGADEGWENLYSQNQRDGDAGDKEQQWHHDELPLHERLHQQLAREPMDEQTRRVAMAIVDSLDDDGYFRADPNAVAALCETTMATVWLVLRQTVQQLEPAGVGARDLAECLSLQLDDCRGYDEAVVAVAQHLLSHQESTLQLTDAAVAQELACNTNTIAAARKLLRQLDPNPGLSQADPSIFIEPELNFILDRDGSIAVEVRHSRGGSVRLSKQWQDHAWQGDDQTFMSNAEKEARWLLQALAQRHDTLLKTGLFLAVHQQAFLVHGAAAIKPLTLKQVAEACGVHESTISRLTSNKYAYTPLGVIELRNFFSGGLETRHGDTIAVPQVLRRIKHMIEKENPAKPLSDQAIFKQLTQEGITIARRTIAKYREQLGFPSSTKRRQR